MTRRSFFALAGAAAAQEFPRTVPHYERPLLDLRKHLAAPVKIAKMELLKKGSSYFARATSTDGAAGIVKTKEIENFIPIFTNLIAPRFAGKDARDLESIVDDAYTRNYKLAGQPLYTPMASAEQAVWDLLGRTANKPAAVLMGGMVRTEIPVYLSGSGRETTAEEEVEVYRRGLEETGAKAVKFKIGGRMSRNADTYPGRTKKLLELSRKVYGDKVVLYADANGSYDATRGIEIGRMLEALNYSFFEEPCPWEEVSETKQVADALKIPLAGGECDSSLWKFQDMITRKVVDIIQPDLNYCGGFLRALRVARMAKEAGILITPHNTQTDAAGAKILQFAAAVPNIGPFMEFPHRGIPKPASWYTPNFVIKDGKLQVPKGPGLGVEYDPDYLKTATVIQRS